MVLIVSHGGNDFYIFTLSNYPLECWFIMGYILYDTFSCSFMCNPLTIWHKMHLNMVFSKWQLYFPELLNTKPPQSCFVCAWEICTKWVLPDCRVITVKWFRRIMTHFLSIARQWKYISNFFFLLTEASLGKNRKRASFTYIMELARRNDYEKVWFWSKIWTN